MLLVVVKIKRTLYSPAQPNRRISPRLLVCGLLLIITSDYAACWANEESWVDSRYKQEILLCFETSRSALVLILRASYVTAFCVFSSVSAALS
jgi:hypothetical protein